MIVSLLRARSILACFRPVALSAALLAVTASLATAQISPYNQIIIFGDSLSDVGNFAHVTQDSYGISYPGSDFNYSDHRFTNSSDTDPGSDTYAGVWHEQLTRRFLGMTPGYQQPRRRPGLRLRRRGNTGRDQDGDRRPGEHHHQ